MSNLTNTHFTPTDGGPPVPCIVIRELPKARVYVEVVNTPKPNGKPDYTNTSLYGNLLVVNKSQLVKP